jgi:PhnB protein
MIARRKAGSSLSKKGSQQVSLKIRRSPMTKAIPEGYHSVTPIFVFKDVRKAIEFYKRAFGAQEQFAMPGPDGKGVMHAEVRMPVQDMFWGDRVGTVQDPFGYSWLLATHVKDLMMQEIQQGAEAEFSQMAKK